MRCSHCESQNIIKHSFYKGVRRYKCKDCQRTFSSKTFNSTYYLKKKDTYQSFVDLMEERTLPCTLNDIQGWFSVSRQTALDWRHRYFISLKMEPKKMKGIIEVDDVNFDFSNKGNKTLTFSRGRGGIRKAGDHKYLSKLVVVYCRETGDTRIELNRMGRMSADDFDRGLSGMVVKKSTVIVSDNHPSLRAYTNGKKIRHQSFTAADGHGAGIVHVNNINNIASRLNRLINQDHRGVSTKYLQNYMNWFVYREYRRRQVNVPAKKKAWVDVITNERSYKKLILDRSAIRFESWVSRKRKTENWV